METNCSLKIKKWLGFGEIDNFFDNLGEGFAQVS